MFLQISGNEAHLWSFEWQLHRLYIKDEQSFWVWKEKAGKDSSVQLLQWIYDLIKCFPAVCVWATFLVEAFINSSVWVNRWTVAIWVWHFWVMWILQPFKYHVKQSKMLKSDAAFHVSSTTAPSIPPSSPPLNSSLLPSLRFTFRGKRVRRPGLVCFPSHCRCTQPADLSSTHAHTCSAQWESLLFQAS